MGWCVDVCRVILIMLCIMVDDNTSRIARRH